MQTAAIIHKSPLLKCSENKSEKSPFNRTRITPKNERIMDRIWSVFTFSFRNNTENNAIEIAFNVEIRPTFVADVFSNAKN